MQTLSVGIRLTTPKVGTWRESFLSGILGTVVKELPVVFLESEPLDCFPRHSGRCSPGTVQSLALPLRKADLTNSGKCSPEARWTRRHFRSRSGRVAGVFSVGPCVCSASRWPLRASCVSAWDAQPPGNRFRGKESSAENAGAEGRGRPCTCPSAEPLCVWGVLETPRGDWLRSRIPWIGNFRGSHLAQSASLHLSHALPLPRVGS